MLARSKYHLSILLHQPYLCICGIISENENPVFESLVILRLWSPVGNKFRNGHIGGINEVIRSSIDL